MLLLCSERIHCLFVDTIEGIFYSLMYRKDDVNHRSKRHNTSSSHWSSGIFQYSKTFEYNDRPKNPQSKLSESAPLYSPHRRE